MQTDPRRRLAALWFADIQGYTRLSHTDEAMALRAVGAMQIIARAEVEARDGRLVKFIGDAALAVFQSTESAVEAALALQAAFALTDEAEASGLSLRIGVHLGDVIEAADGDLYGDGVNMAARIEGEAPAGKVAISEAVFQQIRQRTNYRVRTMGPRTLKGLAEPLELYVVERVPEHEISTDGVTPVSTDPAVAAAQPTHVGPYTLLELLGVGGMGEVWLAEQTVPVRRKVALKVIKLGMDTKQVVARFEAERQALAVMDHPNIAQVFDGGATHEGRPYFVMELVRGIPLTDFCDRHRLTTEKRLRLFSDVCRAVQHAHQKGVVHRDLKPSNILVVDDPARPIVKVIDFGVAKAMGRALTDSTLHTRMDQILGTPDYMSPEHADPLVGDVDTRSDIYSLGVILYELLVGARPYRLAAAIGPAVASVISDIDVARPSAKLTTLETIETVAKNRQTSVSELRRALHGDLDWIVMKAMAKERERRYDTAVGLALEIERYLANEPVEARPPSASYRAAKFVRRHRVGVSVAALLLVLISGFGVATSVQARLIAQERDRAEQERQKAQAVSDFMQDVLTAADPLEGLGTDATILEALDWIVSEHSEGFSEVPVVDAAVRASIGNVYQLLGRNDDAKPLLIEAYRIELEAYGEQHPDVATSLYRFAEIARVESRWDSAGVLLERTIDIRRNTLDAQDPGIAFALTRYAWVLINIGRLDEAEAPLLEALEIFQAQEEEVAVSEPMDVLGQLYRLQGEPERAERYLRDALAVRERLTEPGHPKIGESLNNVAALLDDLGRKDEAASLYRRAIEIQEAVYGPDSENLAASLGNFGLLLTDIGEVEEGEEVLRRALAIDTAALTPDHLYVGIDHHNLARHLCTYGSSSEGLSHVERALQIYAANLEEGAYQMALGRTRLGFCLTSLGRFEEAEGALLDSAGRLEAEFGPEHQFTLRAHRGLADLYDAWGRPEDAARYKNE